MLQIIRICPDIYIPVRQSFMFFIRHMIQESIITIFHHGSKSFMCWSSYGRSNDQLDIQNFDYQLDNNVPL